MIQTTAYSFFTWATKVRTRVWYKATFLFLLCPMHTVINRKDYAARVHCSSGMLNEYFVAFIVDELAWDKVSQSTAYVALTAM